MSKLCGIKQAISPAEDRLAYDRALKRHTDSLCFEDWTCYGAQYEGYLPFVEDTQPTFFPCQDQVNEGTVILLPRKNEREGDEDWHIFVCLDEQDLAELELILEDEGWWQPPTAGCKEPAKK
ncbi:hypothetical protein NM208_g11508 [Fusarium decemcellulare]|uniref:Uncharacterized protein n=1 Tax=Fusarium decemcellulare TaxID=57161 RepID=A0ACC1RSC7_9HYPO|nr:hypothetical protein NM208_g11508 [Fusarium decemcellulare]